MNRQGEVWFTEVQFSNNKGIKSRPVVIVANELAVDIDFVVAPISSQKPRSNFDVELEYWEEAGLDKPSIVRTTKIRPVDRRNLQYQMGTLHPYDLQRVLEACRRIF